jgi:predicted nucleic acid binding AN1-type Zn finger protein
MCSKCYKEQSSRNELVKKVDLSSVVTPVDKTDAATASVSSVKLVAEPTSLARVAESSEEPTKKARTVVDKSRCTECKKKVGLTAIECRCGNVYCGVHRMAEKHACTFDFKSFGRSFIEKANERVVAESLVDKL